jgi:4-hydroxy-2-oxoheptanedioate aldolase
VTYDIGAAVPVGELGSGMRRLIESGRTAYGGWCMIPGPFVAEIVSASGCDWLGIDQQHGLIDDSSMRAMVQAAAIRRVPVLVRVAWNEPAAIMRALDAGADGVIVPMVDSAADAERAVAACRYPPDGIRSYGPLRSALAQPGYTPSDGNRQSVCFVMIETGEALENVADIVAVPGVDGVLVGPNDLSISRTGEGPATGVLSEELEVAIAEIGVRARAHGRAAMMPAVDVTEAKRWEAVGFRLILLPSDVVLIETGLRRALGGGCDGDR